MHVLFHSTMVVSRKLYSIALVDIFLPHLHVHAVTTAEGNTSLHYAARAGHVECFACLLRHGASLEATNLHQQTPQDIARKYGKPKAIATAGKRKLL